MRSLLILAITAASVSPLCASCSSNAAAPVKATYSASGDQQCSAHYQGAGRKTTIVITSSVAGELNVSTAAIGSAERKTLHLLAPGTLTVTANGNPLETLHVTIGGPTGTRYNCSVSPAS